MKRQIRDFKLPVVPTPAMVQFARDLLHQFREDGPRFVIQDRETGNTQEINEEVYELIRQLLIDLAQNRPVAIMPYDHELTTNQAADLLNVSRGYVLKMIEQGALPPRMVGTHRRLRLEDLLALKDKMRADSDRAMDDLARIGQELE